jgi:hypothetical protein
VPTIVPLSACPKAREEPRRNNAARQGGTEIVFIDFALLGVVFDMSQVAR